jgi:hypothetical protein
LLRLELGRVVAFVEELEFAGEGVHKEFRSAAVFGGAGPLAFEEERLLGLFTGGFFLEGDFMDPVFGEVVAVEQAEGGRAAADEGGDGDGGFLLEVVALEDVGVVVGDDILEALAFAMAKLVEVLVLPAHGILDGAVELGEGGRGADRKTAPNSRLDAVHEHFERVAIGRVGRHGTGI